jgi:hypothetical protein
MSPQKIVQAGWAHRQFGRYRVSMQFLASRENLIDRSLYLLSSIVCTLGLGSTAVVGGDALEQADRTASSQDSFWVGSNIWFPSKFIVERGPVHPVQVETRDNASEFEQNSSAPILTAEITVYSLSEEVYEARVRSSRILQQVKNAYCRLMQQRRKRTTALRTALDFFGDQFGQC